MRMKAALLAIVVLGGTLRFLAARDDFWFDEIFSWRIAMNVKSPAEVFTSPEARIDNNHPLNTLFMYALGDRRDWQVYRAFSVVCGIGSIALAVILMWQRNDDAIFAAVLFAFSYPLIVYSSEARGYAPMIFFMLAALIALQRGMTSPKPIWPAIYVLMCILGLLSHLTFLQFFFAALIWSAVVWRNLRKILLFNAVPMIAIVAIYFVFVRHLSIAGGPEASLFESIFSTLSLLVGGSEATTFIGIVAAIVLLASLVLIYRASKEWFMLSLLSFLAAPAFLFVQFVVLNHREAISRVTFSCRSRSHCSCSR